MTLEQLSKSSGLTPNYIGSVETGKRDPSLSTVFALADGLGMNAGELVGTTPKLSPTAAELARHFDGIAYQIQEPILQMLRVLVKPDTR